MKYLLLLACLLLCSAWSLQIPKIGLGTFKLNHTHEEFMKKCIKEGGYRLIDTAQAYGNEEVVGRAVNG